MKLYRTHEGVWHGTQADAGKRDTWEQVEVPVDKAGLLAFLNEMERVEMSGKPVELISLNAESAMRFGSPVSASAARLNLAPLKHGAGWRESVAGMSEAIALMSLPTALRWAQAALERVCMLVEFPVAEDESDDGSDLI